MMTDVDFMLSNVEWYLTRLGVDKVKPKGWFLGWAGGCVEWDVGWHFDNGASSKIDDVLTEVGGLHHVLPLAVHLKFFWADK